MQEATQLIQPAHKFDFTAMTKDERERFADDGYNLILQVQSSSLSTAIALKKLHDMEFHRFLNYDNFAIFIESEMPIIEPQYAEKLVTILDVLGERKQVKELLGKKGGFNLLIAAAKEVQSSEDDFEITDEKIAKIVEKQTAKLKEKNNELRESLKGKEDLVSHLTTELNAAEGKIVEKEEEVKRALNAIGNDTGYDMEKFRRVTNETEILGDLATFFNSINHSHDLICLIPTEQRSRKIITQVTTFIELLRSSANAIESNWITELAEYTPIHKERHSDFRPSIDDGDEVLTP